MPRANSFVASSRGVRISRRGQPMGTGLRAAGPATCCRSPSAPAAGRHAPKASAACPRRHTSTARRPVWGINRRQPEVFSGAGLRPRAAAENARSCAQGPPRREWSAPSQLLLGQGDPAGGWERSSGQGQQGEVPAPESIRFAPPVASWRIVTTRLIADVGSDRSAPVHQRISPSDEIIRRSRSCGLAAFAVEGKRFRPAGGWTISLLHHPPVVGQHAGP